MKIISKFKDYYDQGLGFVQGVDEDRDSLYLREKKIIEDERLSTSLYQGCASLLDRPPSSTSPSFYRRPSRHYNIPGVDRSYHLLYVLFCGKLYRRALFEYYERRPSDITGKFINVPVSYNAYSAESLQHFLDSKTGGFTHKDFHPPSFAKNASTDIDRLFGWYKRYGLYREVGPDLQELLIKNRIIVAAECQAYGADGHTWEEWVWVQDKPLRSIEFYKAVNAFEAYQEIDMYLSGVLGQANKDTVNISDKDRVAQHGYDEWSFRKMPGEKKKRSKK